MTMQHPSYLVLCLLGIAVSLIIHRAHRIIQSHAAQNRCIILHGCQPAARIPSTGIFRSLRRTVSNIQTAQQHRVLETIHGNFQQFGNTLADERLGCSVIITCEPENVKAILSKQFQNFTVGHRVHAQGPLLGHGIFTSDGDQWARSRALLRPNFTRAQVSDLALFEEKIQDLFALIPPNGATLDLQELFFSYTLDSATEFLFGKSLHTLRGRSSADGHSASEVAIAFNYAMEAITMRSRLGYLRVLYFDRKATQSFKICHRFAESLIDHAMQRRDANSDAGKNQQRYRVIDELVRQTDDRRQIRDELINSLIAGRDTTAGLLSNLFFLLAKHQEVWTKLRDEVNNTLRQRLPTYEDLRQMKYLQHCLNEALRLYPVVPINSRRAENDTYLPVGGGPDALSPVFVPKGTMVLYSVYSMHRRDDVYGPNPSKFWPERWDSIRPMWSYLPFNGGPRVCLGQQYALAEAGYVTVRIAQRFCKLESRDPEQWQESLSLTLRSRNGTKVGLVST